MRRPLSPNQRRRVEGLVREKVQRCGLQRRTTIKTQAKGDGLRLLRAIDAAQARGQEGSRVDPTRG